MWNNLCVVCIYFICSCGCGCNKRKRLAYQLERQRKRLLLCSLGSKPTNPVADEEQHELLKEFSSGILGGKNALRCILCTLFTAAPLQSLFLQLVETKEWKRKHDFTIS